MRLKTLLPLTLCLVLTTQTGFAQKKTVSNPISASEYGIDLHQNYTGSQVERLIQIVEQEAEEAIDRAFNEGYKQGLLAGVPEAEYWRVKAERYEAEINRLKRERLIFAFGGLGTGFLLGGGFGFMIRIQN